MIGYPQHIDCKKNLGYQWVSRKIKRAADHNYLFDIIIYICIGSSDRFSAGKAILQKVLKGLNFFLRHYQSSLWATGVTSNSSTTALKSSKLFRILISSLIEAA